MRLPDIIQRATDFGTLRSRDNFFSFTLKILFYIIPAVILGNYTDIIVKRLQEYKTLGENTLYYILIQTFIIISTLYFILKFLSDFISEFQVTIAGGYFIVLYFGMQTNYISMIQEYIN
jgi:type III secretory pathway component EscS